MPRGGLVLRPPLPGPIVRAQVDGENVVPHEAEGFTLRCVPSELVIECG